MPEVGEAPGITEAAKITLDSPPLAVGEATESNEVPEENLESANKDLHGEGRSTKAKFEDTKVAEDPSDVEVHKVAANGQKLCYRKIATRNRQTATNTILTASTTTGSMLDSFATEKVV